MDKQTEERTVLIVSMQEWKNTGPNKMMVFGLEREGQESLNAEEMLLQTESPTTLHPAEADIMSDWQLTTLHG